VVKIQNKKILIGEARDFNCSNCSNCSLQIVVRGPREVREDIIMAETSRSVLEIFTSKHCMVSTLAPCALCLILVLRATVFRADALFRDTGN